MKNAKKLTEEQIIFIDEGGNIAHEITLSENNQSIFRESRSFVKTQRLSEGYKI